MSFANSLVENLTSVFFNFLGITLLLEFTFLVGMVVYNKVYIKRNINDFLMLYYGTIHAEDKLKNNLGIISFFFMTTYFVQLVLNNVFKFTKNNPFPSKNAKNKPYVLTPNAYIENIDKFREVHNSWFVVNWGLNVFIFLFGGVFLISSYFY